MIYSKIIFYIFIIYFVGLDEVCAQEFKAKNLNVEWSEDNRLIITYDLLSPEDSKVEVKIFMKSNNDSSLKVKVKSASGKIGIGQYSGLGNVVVWDIDKDYPNIKVDESYYFTLEASVIKEKNDGWPWYYYVGGALVAGAATFVITSSPESSPSVSKSGFPLPPNRN